MRPYVPFCLPVFKEVRIPSCARDPAFIRCYGLWSPQLPEDDLFKLTCRPQIIPFFFFLVLFSLYSCDRSERLPGALRARSSGEATSARPPSTGKTCSPPHVSHVHG